MKHLKVLAMKKLFFLLILCSTASFALSAKDNLKRGDVLNSTESTFLVSSNNNFTLGLLTLGTNRTYLAIHFTGGDQTKPVWIGNRETSLPTNSSAQLQIDVYGRLILTHNNTNSYLLSSKKTNLNVTAILLDSGNFVLREMNTDGSPGQELWSSFDNPTDTLLPEMKLGENHITGRNWSLTSWLEDDQPATGAFSLEWEPTTRRMVIKYRGTVQWTSGELQNATDFPHITLTGSQIYKFDNASTKEEEYFRYAVTPSPFFSPQDQIKYSLPGWKLNPQGVLYDIISNQFIIDVRDCYGYKNETQQSRGCELWEVPKCWGSSGQTFELRTGTFMNGSLDAEEFGTDMNSSAGPGDCRENCWNDCDCVGYRSYSEGMCGYWRGTNLQFQQDISGIAVQLYVLNRPIKGQSRIKKWIWILIPIMVSIVLLGLLTVLRRRRKREVARKVQELKDLMTLEEYSDIQELANDECIQGRNLKLFSYAWIAFATNNFSSDHKLGHGGFGSVYKAVTPEGQEVAIKQLSESSKQGIIEFKNEVVLIAKLQHTNLVKLFGFCIHGDQKMLIYEFMPNKSLDFYLFDPTRKKQLTWEMRLKIIEGVAQGLLYLHKYSRVRIIHRDMKASNILLDENMNPKISDFGMAKILRQNATEENTMRLGGTFGYMAPEYAMEGIFSTKSDVYSFGVLVLEIVSGKKNNYPRSEDGPLNLVEHAWELWNRSSVLQLVDPALSSNVFSKEEQLHRCINVGLLCVEDFAVDRPSMSDVISMITNENVAIPKPKKPAFVPRCSVAKGFHQEVVSEKFSVNELSITAMEGR